MASTYSTNLGLELIGTGDQSGTWGATTNTNLGTLLEQSIAGYATQAVTDSGVATVLTISNGASSTGRNAVIALTGALTLARVVEVPAKTKSYIFYNATTGGFAVTVKVTGQTGVSVPNGTKAIVYCDGTDVRNVLSNVTVDSSGNVGVGTTTPSTYGKIAAYVPSGTGGIGVSSGGSSGSDAGQFIAYANGTSYNLQSIIYGTGPAYVQTNGTQLIVGTTSAYPFIISTNNTERLRIDSSGNVGIGTSSPTSFGSTSRVLQVQSSDATGYGSVLVGSGTYTMEMLVNQNSGVMSIGSRSNHNLGFATNDTVRATIDTSGNVGIGTTSPNTRLHVHKAAASAFTGTSPGAFIVTDPTNTVNYFTSIDFNTANSTPIPLARIGMCYTGAGTTLNFGTSNNYSNGITNTAVTIDYNGNLLVGQSTQSFGSNGRVSVLGIYGAYTISMGAASTGGTYYYTDFRTSSGTQTGYILSTDGSSTLYSTSSDYRLKDNVVPMVNGLATVNLLKPVTYSWGASGSLNEGFLAHELAEIVPHAVVGKKDAVNEDGSIKPQGVDYSKIVVHLVAAIQELSAKVTALESK